MQRHVSMTQWLQAPAVAHCLPMLGWQNFAATPLPPFAPVIREFIDVLSLRLQQAARLWPDLAALGFWLRRRQIEAQALRMEGRLALGVVFHLVPSNVPTVAFYSWLMALLMGNPSVVRLSSRDDEMQSALLAILAELFADPAWQDIASRTRFIRYGHEAHITAWLSEQCSLRIVWGGDDTIRAIRAIALSPRAQELVFPDRRSMLLIDSRWLGEQKSEHVDRIATALAQDCTRFNQLACASPTTLIWLGQPEPVIRQALLERIFAPLVADPALAMERLVQSQRSAAALPDSRMESLPGVTLLTLTAPQPLPFVGGGVLTEWAADNWEALLEKNWDMQTCVYVGGDLQQARARFGRCHGRVDRIVAPGQALAFDWYWDGIDLLQSCSRQMC